MTSTDTYRNGAVDAVAEPLYFGFPRPALVIMGVEFAERLGYYAVALSLFTYGRHLLGISATGMSAIMNTLYLIIPLAACLSSGFADGPWGRARTLMVFLVTYAVGLTLLMLSALPAAFVDFPLHPRLISYVLFALALCLFAVGYGGMKVCTNPMMADSVTAAYGGALAGYVGAIEEAPVISVEGGGAEMAGEPAPARAFNSTAKQAPSEDGGGPPTDALVRAVVLPLAREAEQPPTPISAGPGPASGPAWPLQDALARAFNGVYWVSNFGSLIGIFASPLMRDLDHRRLAFGSATYTVGYYYGFALATVSVTVGLVFFHRCRRQFPRNAPAPAFVFFRLVARAVRVRVLFALGRVRDPDFQAAIGKGDVLAYGTYPHVPLPSTGYGATHGSASAKGVPGAVENARSCPTRPAKTSPSPRPAPREGALSEAAVDVSGDLIAHTASPSLFADAADASSWLADSRATLRVCRAFVALPIYWLISNQYSTSLMFSVEALDLPPALPPDLFNNINTVTLLVFLATCESVVYPYLLPWRRRGRWGSPVPAGPGAVAIAAGGGGDGSPASVPSPRSRVVVGFLLVVASMLWCGLVQVAIARRGTYVGVEGRYETHPGRARLSAGWLVVPYILQGIAAALVDPASMEVAYTGAPAHMKGTVMALYWAASSASGFLGLVLSPIMKPVNGVALYFGFAAALLVVTGVFYRLNYSCARGGDDAEAAAAGAPPICLDDRA